MNTLIKQLIIVFLVLFTNNIYGQFKMVGDAGSGGFTSLGNNTYSCTITYRPDLTGNFFNGTQTAVGQNRVEVFTSQVLELGDILYAEVTQAGDNVTDLLITLTIK